MGFGDESLVKLDQRMIAEVRRSVQASGRRLIDALEEAIGEPPEVFIMHLGMLLGYPVMRMDELHALVPAFDVLPFTEATRHRCVALRDPSGQLVVVSGDPFADHAKAWVEQHIAEPFDWRLAHPADVAALLARHEDSARALDQVTAVAGKAEEEHGGDVPQLSLQAISEDSSPVVKLVNSTLYDALKANASDIHLETGPSGLTVKYRLDGVLATISSFPGVDFAEQVLSRIKVIAELDIAERRVPQDGRFNVLAQGRKVDFRVSVMPSIYGEDAVLRILDKQALADEMSGLRLTALGFDEGTVRRIRQLSREAYGMLLVTGPTGSGKSTTLYAAVSEINNGEDKIVTIEDPVEYQLPGVLQIPVNERKGLTFARGLRSILRHDPDKILVGEIRDPETAQIAVQAALTGHLVFTTVHANNVFDVIARFMHMGVEPYNMVSAVNAILAQRLVRLLCPHCAVDHQPDAELLAESGIDEATCGEFHFRIGRGCGHCRGTGYKGRKAIAELLVLNDEVRELILARAPQRELREAAYRQGMASLRSVALDAVRRGETTLQEINRVTLAA
jgi:general secretion pathway protein E